MGRDDSCYLLSMITTLLKLIGTEAIRELIAHIERHRRKRPPAPPQPYGRNHSPLFMSTGACAVCGKANASFDEACPGFSPTELP